MAWPRLFIRLLRWAEGPTGGCESSSKSIRITLHRPWFTLDCSLMSAALVRGKVDVRPVWKPGWSGSPAGRPSGSRIRESLLRESLVTAA